MPKDLAVQIHVTLAPGTRATMEALKTFGDILLKEEESPKVVQAWITCIEGVARAIKPVPVEAESARLN
ncbi:MAG: hypothetical protein PHE55_05170 [Methylococcaceae bacterium]|nr:hypothetical protein [Methylococcaceae bacterium]